MSLHFPPTLIPRRTSYSVTDLLAGFGGLSLAASYAGLHVRTALNHWQYAVDVHATNHVGTEHFCDDLFAAHPRMYPATDILVGSPTCTYFTQANPENIKTLVHESQLHLFAEDQRAYEELVARHQGRHTMFGVLDFIEYHQYQYGVLENVVEVMKWSLIGEWERRLRRLGYNFRFLYFNSMFFHQLNGLPAHIPAPPQSRDRWYCVFWRKGNRPPKLDFTPLAPCPNCGDVRAVQVWKRADKQWGKYGRSHGQYYYGCPTCREQHKTGLRPLPVTPYYYAGINAIDWSVPIQRVDDPARTQPVSQATRQRIQAGLDKYGCQPLVLDNAHGHVKSRSALFDPMYTQTGSATQTVCVPPLLVDLARNGKTRPGVEPLYTQTTKGTQGVIVPAFLTELYHGGGARSVAQPLNTVTAGVVKTGLAVAPGFFTEQFGGRPRARTLDAPLNTVTSGGVRNGLACWPFVVTYNGHSVVAGVERSLPTMTTVERHGLTLPQPTVDECYYRTLRSKIEKPGAHGSTYITSEIGAAQGFPQGPDGYKVFGSTDDITKGYGNAVTAAVGYWILRRIAGAMEG